ncbi:MAG: DoxX family protein [Gemmatimonadales bacterium]
MFKKVIHTSPDWVLTVARLTLGLVLFPHAMQKLFGWFGGAGLGGSMQFMTGALGLPAIIAALAIGLEIAAALGLITGLFSRAAALAAIAVMVGAIVTVHANVGFFMNWYGNRSGEGYEYHLLAIGLALLVLVRGGGALSVDRAIAG